MLFQATAAGTHVTAIHRGWSAVRFDHSARHGLSAPKVVRMIRLWWGDQLPALRMQIGAGNLLLHARWLSDTEADLHVQFTLSMMLRASCSAHVIPYAPALRPLGSRSVTAGALRYSDWCYSRCLSPFIPAYGARFPLRIT